MGSVPTTIPPLTSDNFAERISALYPNGWARPDALSPGGVVYSIAKAMGAGLSDLNVSVQYACNATRIQTATNGALDLASEDFFGDALPRNPGETDDAFRARILAAMLPPGATRAAVTEAIEKVTGNPVRVIEPWRPADTGVWGRFYWGVDNARTPFRWTGGGRFKHNDPSTGLQFQGFIECSLPAPAALGGNPVPCYDSNFYWGIPGSSFFDLNPSQSFGSKVVYDAINAAKCEGTIVWVKFVPPITGPTWDGGENWGGGGTWG